MLVRDFSLVLGIVLGAACSAHAGQTWSVARAYGGGTAISSSQGYGDANVGSQADTYGGQSVARSVGIGPADVVTVALSQYGTAIGQGVGEAGPGSRVYDRVYAAAGNGYANGVGIARALNGGVADNTVVAIGTDGGYTNATGLATSDGPGYARNLVHGESHFGGLANVQGSAQTLTGCGGYAQALNDVIGVALQHPVYAGSSATAEAFGGQAFSSSFQSTCPAYLCP